MDLQHCPQRNVPSISKQKMFASTVSKYDPRTKRVTKLQFCIPYTVATDNGGTCKPPPPKCYYYDYLHNTVCEYDKYFNNQCI
jgi:hypothetical protein